MYCVPTAWGSQSILSLLTTPGQPRRQEISLFWRWLNWDTERLSQKACKWRSQVPNPGNLNPWAHALQHKRIGIWCTVTRKQLAYHIYPWWLSTVLGIWEQGLCHRRGQMVMTLQVLQRVGAAYPESGTFINTSFDLEPGTVHSDGKH